jgi:hypothetical protein
MLATLGYRLAHGFDFLNFPGGLTQSDWFGLVTGSIDTCFGAAAYNQGAYTANAAMRQAQLYQEKNYHLGWVSIAREDIREMMSISVNRIDNYNLVATLILATAADALLGVTFDSNDGESMPPAFITHAFWASIGLSIAFFALSVMFGIKGQNSAFVNTMKLLAWELRPENPSRYTHDYMKQAQQFEKDGVSQVFRVPGVFPKYKKTDPKYQEADEQDEQRDGLRKPFAPSSGAGSSNEEEEGGHVLEVLEPSTRRLLYLKRFANYMQLWLPFEWFSKYCIGLGLISLAQGAAYFCLARFFNDAQNYRSTATIGLVTIFTFLTLTILRHNSRGKGTWVRVGVGCAFVSGPALATFAMLAREGWQRVLGPASNFVHFLLYLSLFGISYVGKQKHPSDTANKYCTGPHGQSFDAPERRQSGVAAQSSTGPDIAASASSLRKDACSYDWKQEDYLDADGVSPSHLLAETREAEESLSDVQSTVRALVLLASAVWLSLFIVSLTEAVGVAIAPGGILDGSVLTDVSQVEFPWPAGTTAPHAMSCSKEYIFVANRFRVFRLVDGSLRPEPCKLDAAIADMTLTCESSGICRPLILLNTSGSDPQVTDCSGKRYSLLQVPLPAEKFLLMNSIGRTNPLNNTLLSWRAGDLTEFEWGEREKAWSPLWERASLKSIQGMDSKDGKLFVFYHARDSFTGVPMNHVSVENFRSAVSLGKWRLHQHGSSGELVVSGCASSSDDVLLLTNEGMLYRGRTG